MLKSAQEMSLMNYTGEAPVSNLTVRTLLNMIGSSRFSSFTPRRFRQNCFPPKPSKLSLLIRPSIRTHIQNPPPLLSSKESSCLTLKFLEIWKGSGQRWPWLMPLQSGHKVPVPEIMSSHFLTKNKQHFLMLWCRQQFQKIALSGHIFVDTSVSHTDYYWNMRQSWDFPTSAWEKIRSNGCPLTRLCCSRYWTPWWQI